MDYKSRPYKPFETLELIDAAKILIERTRKDLAFASRRLSEIESELPEYKEGPKKVA